MTEQEVELLQKKLHNVQRTKLRLKNNLNQQIEELKKTILDLEEKYKDSERLNKKYKEKLDSVKWAQDWDNLE
tara:strand:- start:1022 stop:1240 length:219 start_codon:yes stop_codon:yes gene_type:complete